MTRMDAGCGGTGRPADACSYEMGRGAGGGAGGGSRRLVQGKFCSLWFSLSLSLSLSSGPFLRLVQHTVITTGRYNKLHCKLQT